MKKNHKTRSELSFKNSFGQIEKLEDRVMLTVDFFAGPLTTPTNRPDVGLGTVGGFSPIEPAVSVNPSDAGNIVVSSHRGIQVSNDGGGNFGATQLFQFAAGQTSSSGDTDTAFDSRGRLFWANLGGFPGQRDVTVVQVDPTDGTPIGATSRIPNGGFGDDKPFIAADSDPLGISPHADNLYVAWSRFGVTPGQWEVFVSRSTDQAQTWSTPVQLSNFATEGLAWPAEVKVAANGDVYVAYHSQPDINDNEMEGPPAAAANPNGTSGQIFVLRSTDGGQTFTQKEVAIQPGQADVTYNRQAAPTGNIPGTQFWMLGAPQPWLLTDAARPGNVYVVSNDDPDNNHGVGDDGDIVISRSGDNGLNWTTSTISSGGGSHQLFPTAEIDRFGNIVASWYDTRRGLTNAAGNFLLDVFATYSVDGGVTWASEFMVNDPTDPLDPDVGAVNRFPGDPVPTLRIGEYFNVDLFGGTSYVSWNGPNPVGGVQTSQQVVYDSFAINGTLVVTGDENGFAQDDTITLRRMATNTDFIEVLVNGQRQYAGLLNGLQQINVDGLGGNDTLIVDSSNGVLNSPFGIRYDGGSGIDSLTMSQVGGSQTSETIVVGATFGSGTDTIVGAGGTQVVQFDNLEPIITNVAAANLFINGGTIGSLLNTSNAINYTDSNLFGATWGLVTIDAFEPIHFTNKTNLNIDAEAGSDLISLNNPNQPTGLTNLIINGNDPTASGDTLVVNGVAGTNEDFIYTPTATGAGSLTGGVATTFSGVEHLAMVGQAGDADGLRVLSTAGNDAYEWTAAATNDAGMVTGTTGTFSIVAVSYTGMTSFVVPLSTPVGGTDTLTINGTDADDTFNVNDRVFPPLAATFPSIVVNGSAPIFFHTATNQVTLRGLSGNDTFDVTLSNANNHSFRIEGGDSDPTSDTLNLFGGTGLTETVLIEPGTVANHQDITGLNSPITASGVELLTFSGENNDDTLIVELEDGFKTALLQDGPDGNGPAYDQLFSDVLPLIRFRDLAMLEIDNDDLGDVTIITDDLNEAATWLVDGDGDETLIIQGSDAEGDSYTISNDATGNVQIVDNNEAVTITTTGINGPNDRLLMRTGGHDDTVTVDVNGTDLIDVLITYDGGSGKDDLNVSGTPSVTVNDVTYTPGPSIDEGRIFYDSTGNEMTIDFVNLEPVTDTVAATNLTINGTNGNNTFNLVDDPGNAANGRLTVDGFELFNFSNKTNLNLNGQGGTDLFQLINTNLPTGLTNINVNGGAGTNDRLEVIGSALADTFTVTAGNVNYNNSGFANPLDIGFGNVESMLVAGRDAADRFFVQAVSVSSYFSGNAGDDVFDISSIFGHIAGDLNGITSSVSVNGGVGANNLVLGDYDDVNGNPNVVVTSNAISGMAPVTINYASTAGTTKLILHGSNSIPNADVFNIQTFRAVDTLEVNGNAGMDIFRLRSGARGDTTLVGWAGRDQFFVDLVGGGARQVIVAGVFSNNDYLRVNGTSGNDVFVVTNGNVNRALENVRFFSTETLQIDGAAGMDTFNVQSTFIATFLNGDSDNDLFNLSSLAPTLTGTSNLDGITGVVSINGGTGVNTLKASDHGSFVLNTNVIVTSSQILNFAPATINYMATNGVMNLDLFGSDRGADTFTVNSLDSQNRLLIEGNAFNDTFIVRSAVLGDVTLKGETGVDTFLVELAGFSDRQVTAIGGSGNDSLTVEGSSSNEFVDVSAGNIGRGAEDVNYDSIGRLFVNGLLGDDTFNVYSTAAPLTLVIGHVGNDRIFVHNTTGATNRMIVNAGGGDDYVLVRKTDNLTKLVINGQAGNDHVDVGSSAAQNNGNLNDISGRVIVRGNAGSDLLSINDRGANGKFDYRVLPNWVVNNPNGIARPAFAGIQYTGNDVENLRLAGTDQRNEFEVTPSFDTHIFIDGNLPTRAQITAASQGDFLNLVTTPGDGHKLTLIDRDTGTGNWAFTNGAKTINFTEIEFFNHVERLAVGVDVAENPTLKVYDAETRAHLFTVQAYEPFFRGGVRVATGDINADGIPDIIAAPGPGRAPTVKVFDGWDGTLITEFDAYEPYLFDGVFVAAGQVTGDAAIDIVTTPGPGRQLQEVRVFRNSNNGTNMTLVDNYLPYESTFSGGASVAVADINGDGFGDVITGRLIGKADVAVFDSAAGNGAELARFRAIDDSFRGGIHVAAANYLGDATPDVLVSTGYNVWGSQFDSQVFVFDGSNLQFSPFATVASDFRFQAFFDPEHPEASLRLVGKDHDLDGNMDELFAAQGRHGTSLRVKVFQPLSATVTDTIFLADTPDFDEGFFLG